MPPLSARRRESGGIGRRAGLRIQWGNPWEFESPLSHHLRPGDYENDGGLTWQLRRNLKSRSNRRPVWSGKLKIRVPSADIEREIASRLAKVGKTAKLKGFRPGKIPEKVVRKYYGGQVRDEVLST